MNKERETSQSVEQVNKEFFGEFFNENTVDYLNHSAGSRWFKDLLLMILKHISPSEVTTVADVGCGIGHKTAILKTYFSHAEVSGFDFSSPAIDVAKKAYGPRGIHFSCDDITRTDYANRFDLIAAFDVLEHIDDWQKLAKNLIAVNNRYFLISVPVGRMRPYEVHIGHFRNFQTGQLEEFMSSMGYRTLKTFYAGFPFFSPILRDLTNKFFKQYSQTTHAKMTWKAKMGHHVWYVLFRYLSMKHKGDVFIGLFEKSNGTNSHTAVNRT